MLAKEAKTDKISHIGDHLLPEEERPRPHTDSVNASPILARRRSSGESNFMQRTHIFHI